MVTIEKISDLLDSEKAKKMSVQEWKEYFSKECSGLFSTKPYFLDFQYLYRARKSDIKDLFPHAKKMWAPKKQKVGEIGRCNRKAESMLYCSSTVLTPIFEIQPPTGKRISIMEYKCLSKVGPFSALGIDKISQISDNYHEFFKNHFIELSEQAIRLDQILSKLFQLQKEDFENFNLYNLTCGISSFFLHNQKGGKGFSRNGQLIERNLGLIFPSVQTKIEGCNVVLYPTKVKDKLKPSRVFSYIIEERVDRHHYHIRLTHESERIRENGEIVWGSEQTNPIEYITDIPVK